jgi:hypothetical protein
MTIDKTQLTDVEVEGLDMADFPKFCDAFIGSATYQGRELTDQELDQLSDDTDFVQRQIEKQLY